MFKMLIVLVSLVSLVLAEPPVSDGYEQAHRQYLPPDLTVARAAKSSYDDLSRQYPEAINGIPQEYGSPSFRNDISQEYGAPFTRNSPSSVYGAPNARVSVSEEYNAPSARFSLDRSEISPVYGAPSSRNPPSETYGSPDQRSISQQYGAPDSRSSSNYAVSRNAINRYPSPVLKYGVPRFSQSNQYSKTDSASSFGLQRQSQYNNNLPQTYSAPRSLSSQYGAPEARTVDSHQQGFGQSPSNTYGAPRTGAPAKQYGVPESRAAEEHTNALASSYSSGRSSQAQGYDAATHDDSSSGYAYSRNALEELLNQEPASYEFGYKVSDYTSGSDFGHVESRQAERAEGSYFVVLPDGTKQVVEYEADERGFKPRISVEAAESGPY